MFEFEQELQIASEAVRKASLLCRRVRETLVTEETVAKKDRSPVTVADFASQAIINLTLSNAFPNDPIMAEEDSATLRANNGLRAKVMAYLNELVPDLTERQALDAIDKRDCEGGRQRFWTLDPIDGTKGYIRGDQYAVALALLQDGEVVLSVLGCPNLPQRDADNVTKTGFLFTARKGIGAEGRALEDDQNIKLATTLTVSPADAVFCESFESAHSSHDASGNLLQKLGTARPPLRIDSQAKYAAVARGDADVYLRLPTRADYEERLWDHAAGWLLVKEAGGEITDISGKPLDFSIGRTLAANKGVVVTNGRLHANILKALV